MRGSWGKGTLMSDSGLELETWFMFVFFEI